MSPPQYALRFVAIILSLLTAVVFGTGDFFGGLATKRASVLQVVAGSHFIGLVSVALLAPFVADEFTWGDFGLGMIGGMASGVGVALLYRGLAQGPMAVVAPTTAITSAVVPAFWGVATGDRLGPLAWLGVVVALIAIGLISTAVDDSGARITGRVIVESLLAGAGFGLFFIFLDLTSEETTPWPIVGSRTMTTAVLMMLLLVLSRSRSDRGPNLVSIDRATAGLIVATGIFDTGANVLFLLATNTGLLTLVSVLSSLYPAATVVLARIVLGERMSRLQIAGFFAALMATTLIAAG